MSTSAPQANPYAYFDQVCGRAEESVIEERHRLCRACDRYVTRTHQCRECWCFMDIKARRPGSTCPLGKWGPAPAAKIDGG